MNEIIKIPVEQTLPSREDVYEKMDIYDTENIPDETKNTLSECLNEYEKIASPAGIIKEISKEEFRIIFEGEGKNRIGNPIAKLFPEADNLALFSVTLGKNIDIRMKELFIANLYISGYMLDDVASCASEKAACYIVTYFRDELIKKGFSDSSKIALRYMPGCCGWDISGRKKIFDSLNPEQIDLSLNSNYHFIPSKSLTGIIINGDKQIHEYEHDSEICAECDRFNCKRRIKKIQDEQGLGIRDLEKRLELKS